MTLNFIQTVNAYFDLLTMTSVNFWIFDTDLVYLFSFDLVYFSI